MKMDCLSIQVRGRSHEDGILMKTEVHLLQVKVRGKNK